MSVQSHRILSPLVAAPVAAAVFGLSFAVGLATVHSADRPNPIRLEQGIPVGVLDTSAGALAAGANYIEVERRTSATNPAEFDRLVALTWAPGARAAELAAELQAVREAPAPADVHLLTDAAAGKLEHYRDNTAQLELWSDAVYWSAAIAPAQTWALDQLVLRWSAGRWLVISHLAAQAPVPRWATVEDGNDTSRAFDVTLKGMSAPYYGAR